MSLNTSKLEKVCIRGDKTTARCPACAEAGHDQKGEHLLINGDGSFGCVLYAGDSSDAKEHRKRIFGLCGDREIRPLTVRPAALGRLGRVNKHHSAGASLKTDLLGRLGRVFETHVERGRERTHRKNHNTDEQHERLERIEAEYLTPPDCGLSDAEAQAFDKSKGELNDCGGSVLSVPNAQPRERKIAMVARRTNERRP